jgi:hypothetical protein
MNTPHFTFKDLLKSFASRKVLSKAQLLQELGCSTMTLWRRLGEVGYFTSYNYNAQYYTLATIPQFDDCGLWSYHDIRFSKWGKLPETIVTLIERSPAGMTAQELADLLRVPNAKPWLTPLIVKHRLWRKAWGRSFVYLAIEPSRQQQQLQRRMELAPVRLLPQPPQIVALLVEMIRHPQQTPQQWARRLARSDIHLGIQEINAVMDYYHLTAKKGLLNS